MESIIYVITHNISAVRLTGIFYIISPPGKKEKDQWDTWLTVAKMDILPQALCFPCPWQAWPCPA